MKKHTVTFFISIMILIIFPVMMFAQDYDFRKVIWGMTPEQVKTSETLEVIGVNDHIMAYDTTLLCKDIKLMYSFTNGKLTGAYYLLFEEHTNKNLFITDYNDFKKALTKKYKEPETDRIVWINDLFKSDPSNHGIAISYGHLSYLSTWNTDGTTINLMLMGDNFRIRCAIVYESVAFSKTAQESFDKRVSKGL